MGKVSWLGRLWERRLFFISFGGTLAAVLGVPSAILTLLGKHFSEELTASLVLAAVAFSALINRHRWRQPHLVVNDIMSADVDNFRRKIVHCPCTSQLAHQVGVLAQRIYGAASITPEGYEPLRAKNKYILACLTGPDGDFLGYFDVIPLTPSFADLFMLGQVSERDMTVDNILDAHDMGECTHVYISGLAAVEPRSPAGMKNASILTWALLKYMDEFYGSTRAYALASAVTKEGEKLLRKFKLHMHCEATYRRDKHAMYTMSLSHDEIVKRLACLPDYGSICSLDWSPNTPSTVLVLPRGRKPLLPQQKLHRVPGPFARITKSG